MIERDIIKQIGDMRKEEHAFIKWWRKENDFLDYEVIDSFIENASDSSTEIDGFELLSMEEMWDALKTQEPRHLKRTTQNGAEVITWDQPDIGIKVYPYNPETVMEIFNVVTQDNPVD